MLDTLRLSCETHLWLDSTVALAWIWGHLVRWKTYVTNRVSEIQCTLPEARWRHVESKENPADCTSRGILASELRAHDLWLSGPRWLLEPPGTWPNQSTHDDIEPPEQWLLTVEKPKKPTNLLTRYSSLDRLQQIVAWCLRF